VTIAAGPSLPASTADDHHRAARRNLQYGLLMAKVSVSAMISASPEKTWATAADMSRFGEWLTLHDGWRGELPAEIVEGTELTSVVAVKGLRNRITWRRRAEGLAGAVGPGERCPVRGRHRRRDHRTAHGRADGAGDRPSAQG
jgi:hypothetical protein